MMLRTIHLYDDLADRFGPVYKFNIATPQEALQALHVNVPGFLKSIKRDGTYAIVIGKDLEGRSLTDKFAFQSFFKDHENDIHILPVIAGSGGGGKGVVGIILGVVLIGLAIWNPVGWVGAGALFGAAGSGAALSGATWGITAGAVGLFGATLALGGVSSLLSSSAVASAANYSNQERPENRPSYIFNSPVNRVEQGGALPIIYGGPIMVGSIVVAAGMTIRQTGAGSGYQGGGVDNSSVVPPPVSVEIQYAVRYTGGNWGEYIWYNYGLHTVAYGGLFQWTETIDTTTFLGTKIDKYQFNDLPEVTVNDYGFTFTSADPLYTTSNVMRIYRSYYYTPEIS